MSSSRQTDCSTGSYSYPPGCTDCDYTAEWVSMGDGHIRFTVAQKHSESQANWISVGFSDDAFMVSSHGFYKPNLKDEFHSQTLTLWPDFSKRTELLTSGTILHHG